jgi:hypothetical protein
LAGEKTGRRPCRRAPEKKETEMPIFQEMSERLNYNFNRQNIGNMPRQQFAAGELIDFFDQRGMIASSAMRDFIMSIPESIRATIRAVYNSALNRDDQVPVTIAWMPGYDYEVTVSESAGTPESIGGITILVRTRYPGDPHPSRRGRREASTASA